MEGDKLPPRAPPVENKAKKLTAQTDNIGRPRGITLAFIQMTNPGESRQSEATLLSGSLNQDIKLGFENIETSELMFHPLFVAEVDSGTLHSKPPLSGPRDNTFWNSSSLRQLSRDRKGTLGSLQDTFVVSQFGKRFGSPKAGGSSCQCHMFSRRQSRCDGDRQRELEKRSRWEIYREQVGDLGCGVGIE